MLGQLIKGRIEDNPSLVEDDPMHEVKLAGLGSPELCERCASAIGTSSKAHSFRSLPATATSFSLSAFLSIRRGRPTPRQNTTPAPATIRKSAMPTGSIKGFLMSEKASALSSRTGPA